MEEFLKHVKDGFSQTPKKISSCYFYDAKGAALFQQIMRMEEYYLPKCEMQIINSQSIQIAKRIAGTFQKLQVVELGAGDGSKTKHLLKQFLPFFECFEFVALDISPHILEVNKRELKEHIPTLRQSCIAGNYFETYKEIPPADGGRLVLFLGANIGNYPTPAEFEFFELVKSKLKKKDYFLVAFDMVKYPRKIIKAYDDSQGVTREFNLNLLTRMNRELGADFDIAKFDHYPFYNPLNGNTSSQIISLEAQKVTFVDGFVAEFEAYEAIHTEISKKFRMSDIENMATKVDMRIIETYYDLNKEYAYVLFQSNG